MKNYSSIIIDDEVNIQEGLKIQLKNFCPQIKVLDCADDVKNGFALINQKKPDIIFLDISMPGETGFDLLEYFNPISFEIIFVTGYEEYAVKAHQQIALEYLLKPVDNKLLVQAVQRVTNRIDERKHANRIAISFTDETHYVKVANIISCEGWKNYTKIHLKNGNVLNSAYSIGKYEDRLKSYNFRKVHKSYLINEDEVIKYLKNERVVIMSDDSRVPVSRNNGGDFLDFLKGK